MEKLDNTFHFRTNRLVNRSDRKQNISKQQQKHHQAGVDSGNKFHISLHPRTIIKSLKLKLSPKNTDGEKK